jgi:bacterial cell division membrane protein
MFDRYNLKNYNFRCILYVILLNIIGILVISSASNRDMALVGKQVMGMGIGVCVMLILSFLPYDKVLKFAVPIYILCVLALVMVLIFGTSRGVAKRWIIVPVIGKLQPSEFVKGGLVVFFAWFLGKYKNNINNVFFLIGLGIIASVPFMLVAMQPDLSTTLILVVSVLCMIYVAGINYKWIVGSISILVPSVFVYIELFKRGLVPSFLRGYQLNRILGFIDKTRFADNNIQQDNSIMAIGSGQLFGKGLNNDTLSSVKRGNYLVEEQTDFIFAVIGEELGFIGCMLVIILLSLIVYEFLYMAMKARDMQGRLLCAGFAGVLSFQFFTNIAVATGIFPNTGLPLPFISYGVSSLLSMYIWVGISLNVGLQKNNRIH